MARFPDVPPTPPPDTGRREVIMFAFFAVVIGLMLFAKFGLGW